MLYQVKIWINTKDSRRDLFKSDLKQTLIDMPISLIILMAFISVYPCQDPSFVILNMWFGAYQLCLNKDVKKGHRVGENICNAHI